MEKLIFDFSSHIFAARIGEAFLFIYPCCHLSYVHLVLGLVWFSISGSKISESKYAH